MINHNSYGPTALVVALCVIACACTADPRDAAGCKVGTRRCDADWVQLCVPDPRTRLNTWVNAVDCTELDEDACEEQPTDHWAECVPTEHSAVR